MSPVFDVFMFDDATYGEPQLHWAGHLYPDHERVVILTAHSGWAVAPLERRA